MLKSFELKPEQVGSYLKMITAAILEDSHNKGSLRKAIWLYLIKHYSKAVDYTEFLFAIKRFINDGKIINRDGIFTIH